NPWILSMLASIEGFPETPWQMLIESQRNFLKGYKDEIAWFVRDDPPLLFQISRAIDSKSLSEWHQRTQWMRKDGTVISGFFRISGNCSASELLKRFQAFVSQELPNCQSDEGGRPGRKGVRDALNALGALRLRFCCQTFRDAKVRMKPGANVKGTQTGLSY